MLVGKKGLAKTSQTPGKTLLINHFSINNGEWYIVDLPGYGYAARGKAQREALKKLIDEYILYREQMTLLFVLIDIRHAPQKVDLDFFDWIGENGIPFAIIFTKADKLGPVAAQRNVDEYKRRLLTQWEELPPIFVTSSERGSGRDELLAYIEEVNADVAAAKAEE
jgi:GTP-binding protein